MLFDVYKLRMYIGKDIQIVQRGLRPGLERTFPPGLKDKQLGVLRSADSKAAKVQLRCFGQGEGGLLRGDSVDYW